MYKRQGGGRCLEAIPECCLLVPLEVFGPSSSRVLTVKQEKINSSNHPGLIWKEEGASRNGSVARISKLENEAFNRVENALSSRKE